MSHWYQQDGTPLYRIIGANGKERDTTLADARKKGLLPSSTGIARLIAKEQVEKWKRDILMSVIVQYGKLPEDELLVPEWNKKILILAKEEWERASSRGTELHDKLEAYFQNQILDEEDSKYLEPVIQLLDERFPEARGTWISEASFAHQSGYGGKVDLYSSHGEGIIIDFKTKAKDKLDDSMLYDDYCQQLASYRVGLDKPRARCYNILISTTVPGVLLYEWPEEDLQVGYKKFEALLAYWKLVNKIDTSFKKTREIV